MKPSFSFSVFTTLLVVMQNTRAAAQETSDTICISDTKVYTAKVSVVASELGYYMFEECGDTVNPTIGMEFGETYTFVQKDRSNFYHPLGFAYYPDGAHDDVNELEPGIANNDAANSCESTMSCPAPMYFLNDEYLGKYSNIPAVKPPTIGEDDFGLDVYEPEFFYPLADWTGQGEYKIMLNYNNDQYEEDIFYFCHIHQYMTGRIKLLEGGVPVNQEDSPPLEYEYDVPGEFDQECGTYGLDAFQLPHKECPSKFVCMAEDNTTTIEPSTKLFADCIDAMNCHMLAGMTTKLSSNSKKALFMQQMIPHHQNAVNMAKSLLHLGTLDCPNLEEETSDCTLETILREIIVNQNFQIQAMRGILEAREWPEKDDCEVLIPSSITGVGGDPHFKTWAGIPYDFHGICDMLFLKASKFADGIGLEIHIRTKKTRNWSYVSSASVCIGDDILEVVGGSERKIWMNGEPQSSAPSSISGFPITFNEDHKKRIFIFHLSSGAYIQIKTWHAYVSVSIDPGTSGDFQSSVGMMGTFPEGIKVARDNVTRIYDNNAFGQEWQVLATEPKLFHNIEGPQSPEQCEIPSVSQLRRRLSEADITKADAKKACEHVAEDFDLCFFDVLATNDKDTANAY